jgi:peptide/nickel transport system ATP-binding protein
VVRLFTPGGCYFHPRCRYAQDRCSTDEPELRPIVDAVQEGGADAHSVACHYAEVLNLRGVVSEGATEDLS